MDGFALMNHAVNLLAPALWLALLLPTVIRRFTKGRGFAPSYTKQVLILFGAGSVCTVTGLVLLGRDGKMLNYLVLVVVMASVQGWWLRERRPRGR